MKISEISEKFGQSHLDEDQGSDCSSIRFEQTDRLEDLNARYDLVLEQIAALEMRIQGLLSQLPLETPRAS